MIIGTDIKAIYLNDEQFKLNEKNKPRIFANALEIKETKIYLKKYFYIM